MSKRLVCQSNLKGIGISLRIYANENSSWLTVPFDETAVGSINYAVPAGGGLGTIRSPSRSQPSAGGPGGAAELSTTRALWMLARTGAVTPRQFTCPESGDTENSMLDFLAYYDFAGPTNVSYAMHVPFGPPNTRIGPGCDNRMAVAADKGPYVDATVATPPPGLSPDAPFKAWASFNSGNHNGLGQNVLYADGHASFERVPVVGVDHDNIYTIALDNINDASRTAGESPWMRSAHPHAPVDADGIPLASTDSVIFP